MRTAIFGGSFNPFHVGHLVIADEILGSGLCGRILFVPAFLPPHKSIEDPGARFRLAMVGRSIEEEEGLGVDDCEILRKGVSYSIDTISYLVEGEKVEPNPLLVIGDDLVGGFKKWKNPDALLKVCEILIVHRRHDERIHTDFPHRYVDNPIIPISSTMVRDRILRGKPWRFLVPEGSRKVIEENGLYGIGTK